MSKFNELYSLDFNELRTETDDAWLVLIEQEEIWFSKSKCDLSEATSTIEVPGWLIAKKEEEHGIDLI